MSKLIDKRMPQQYFHFRLKKNKLRYETLPFSLDMNEFLEHEWKAYVSMPDFVF